MCLNHSKYNGFCRISLLSARQRFGVGEVVFGVISTLVGDLWATLFGFLGYWKDLGIFIDLG